MALDDGAIEKPGRAALHRACDHLEPKFARCAHQKDPQWMIAAAHVAVHGVCAGVLLGQWLQAHLLTLLLRGRNLTFQLGHPPRKLLLVVS